MSKKKKQKQDKVVKDILVRAATIVLCEGWTRKWFAKDERGKDTEWWNEDAVKFCAVGAIHKARKELIGFGDEVYRITDTVVAEAHKRGLPKTELALSVWNDDIATSAEEVAELLLAAAES